MSALRDHGYGDGRTGSGQMPGGNDWMGPERNGATPTGIPVPGTGGQLVAGLAGQPPLAPIGTMGDLAWLYAPKIGYGL